MVKITWRSDWGLEEMDLQTELQALREDTLAVCRDWRDHPRRNARKWGVACSRVFIPHEQNNRFRKGVFLGFSVFAMALVIGQAGFDWHLDIYVLAGIVATWLISVGVMLGYELERVEVAGATFEINYDTKSNDDNS